ncbi:MAG: cytochrome c3 family protein [Phycisphaerales bacterium]|nr:cytochrome c3 family protein [Phycisphaerales bacterium]
MYLFPKWVNGSGLAIAIGALALPAYLGGLLWYGASPKAMDVGYKPTQPIEYSHALHAGKLGIDCRYCHTAVESAPHAAIPSAQTCMGCHTNLRGDSPKLEELRKRFNDGMPIEWVRVHDISDFAYFDHSAHVNRGVGCVECHGRVDRMEKVFQAQPLSMAWCLDCHRNPDARLRPPELVTKMDWSADAQQTQWAEKFRKTHNINPKQDCSTCHR